LRRWLYLIRAGESDANAPDNFADIARPITTNAAEGRH